MHHPLPLLHTLTVLLLPPADGCPSCAEARQRVRTWSSSACAAHCGRADSCGRCTVRGCSVRPWRAPVQPAAAIHGRSCRPSTSTILDWASLMSASCLIIAESQGLSLGMDLTTAYASDIASDMSDKLRCCYSCTCHQPAWHDLVASNAGSAPWLVKLHAKRPAAQCGTNQADCVQRLDTGKGARGSIGMIHALHTLS
jgi:hypothetical protein